MAQNVLVVNKYTSEARGIVAALGSAYAAKPITEMGELFGCVGSASALILDTNFSEAQGVDVLMDVLARVHIPVLMITPIADQACAVEAMRCGAASYLVKTETYSELVPMALGEAIHRSSAVGVLKREIIDLRKRIGEFEMIEKTGRLANASRIASGSGAGLLTARAEKPKPGKLDELVARLRNGELSLPAYPQIALKLREMLATDVGITEIARLLSQDAAVSAKMLLVANSAQYANTRKVDSIEKAVSRLGLASACNIAEMIANRSLYAARNSAYLPLLEELWIHSMACAHACMIIGALVERAASPKLFSLGLLHDAGKLAILQAVAQSDAEGKLIAGEEGAKAFRAFMHSHHSQFGVAIMQRWRFDEDFQLVARHHDDLNKAKAVSRPLLIVHLANLLVRSRGYGEALEAADSVETAPSKAYLFPGEADLDAIGEAVDKAVEKTRAMLQ